MDPFIGQIMIFGGNFAPRGWASCHGQLLSINENEALFSILGTTYGGDGRTTFGLPDLRGRVAMHQGEGRPLGQKGGRTAFTLESNQLPKLNLVMKVSTSMRGNFLSPDGNYLAGGNDYSPSSNAIMALDAITTIKDPFPQPISTLPPFQVVNYIIAVNGIFPSRS